ncbi:MAG: aminoacyl-tRNA hydrolase [Deltaproteobacteria bacterium]|nr:aminoacyl-tRNA hydrolase [Deltaproteobacteria bacterium]
MLVVNAHIHIPLWELDFSFARSSGPGGQNVNKVNSKAVLHWNVVKSPSLPAPVRSRFLGKFQTRINEDGAVVLSSDRFRDQSRNVDDCMKKLRDMLIEVAVPPKARRKTTPTRGSTRRRLEGKQVHAEKKKGRRSVRNDY